MVVLVCGSREWRNFEVIRQRLVALSPSKVLHGACRGADKLSGDAAEELGLAVEVFPADWKAFGKGAGPKRNQRMLDEGKPDLVLAFHSDLESSRGTSDMVRRARKAGVRVEVVSDPSAHKPRETAR
jgi:hypothetical protein